jgi:hypothetical protein
VIENYLASQIVSKKAGGAGDRSALFPEVNEIEIIATIDNCYIRMETTSRSTRHNPHSQYPHKMV